MKKRTQTCEKCHGKGRVPYTCECCGGPLAHLEALCTTCLANKPPCYERGYERRYFSPKQLAAYERKQVNDAER